MHPKFLQAHLHAAGSSPAQLARELGVSRVSLSEVIAGRRVSSRIAAAICQATGLAASEAFPGQYPLLAFQQRLMADQPKTPLQEAA